MKIEVSIPENLNDITLGQYQRFLKIENPSEEDILKIFLNLDFKGLAKVKANDVEKYSAHIVSLFEQEQEHQMRFVLNGVEFGFIPKLDDITYGENKDVTSYLNDWDSMNKAMAVLYRPIKQKLGSRYLIEDYEGSYKYSELMKQMPLSVAMGSIVFFYNLTNELLKVIPNYLEKQTKTDLTKGVISEENGVAIKKYIHLLKETSEDLTKLQDFRYTLV